MRSCAETSCHLQRSQPSSVRRTGYLNRVVNGFVRDVQAKRIVGTGLIADKLEHVSIDQFGRVSRFGRFCPAVPPVVLVVVANVTDEIDVSAVVSDEVIEPMVLRMEVVGGFRVSLVPFSNQGGCVAGLPQ